VVSGNYLEEIPEGFDVLIMSGMSNQCTDERFDRVLSLAKDSMHYKSKIYINEFVMDTSLESYNETRYWDVVSMITQDGKNRTREELEVLLTRNGLMIHSIHQVKNLLVIEAIKI